MNPASSSHGILAGPALRAQPDGRLVKLAREGCRPAVEEIVRRYRPALVRYAATIVPSDRADDVVQDSLARALPAIESAGRELHVRGWLYTIVHNTALNSLRDAGPRHEQLDESYDGVEQPPQALERRESVRALVGGLQGLPQPQREALVKRELGGMSHSQIALDLGVSAGAARQLIFRARNALRNGLGSLVPLPLVRYLVERGTVAEAGAAGGGAIALKTAVAMLATGAAVTAGVAIKSADHHRSRTVADSAHSGRHSTAAPLHRSSRQRAARAGNRSPNGGGWHHGGGDAPAAADAGGSEAIGSRDATLAPGGSSGTRAQGRAPSGGGSETAGSPSRDGSLSGAVGDGTGDRASGESSAVDGTSTSDSLQAADGGHTSGGTSTDSSGSEPSGSDGGGSTSGDGSTSLSSEPSTETTSSGSSGDISGTN